MVYFMGCTWEKIPQSYAEMSNTNVGDEDKDMYYDTNDMLTNFGELNRNFKNL